MEDKNLETEIIIKCYENEFLSWILSKAAKYPCRVHVQVDDKRHTIFFVKYKRRI